MIGKKLINTGGAAVENLPSGYFNTVTYTGNGGSQRIGGYINRGAVFNGSSSVIVTTLGNSQLPVSSSWSCSCWINSSSFSSATNILGMEDGSSPYYGWSLYQNTSGVLYPMVNGNLQGSGTTLTANQWYNVILTYNGTVLKFYVNGSQIGSDITTSISAPSSNFDVGNLGIYSVYNGKVDQVRIFDKALSSSEVTTLYGETHASTTISTTDIFSDNSGLALYQLDGNANDTGTNDFEHHFFVSDAGSSSSSVRLNSTDADFTYTRPSGYSEWGGAFDVNNQSHQFAGNSSYVTLSESNKKWDKSGSQYNAIWGENSYSSGKYYFELEYLGAELFFGIIKQSTATTIYDGNVVKENSISYGSWNTTSYKYSTTNSSQGTALSTNDVLGFAVDFDNRELKYYINNTLQDTTSLQEIIYNGTATNVTYQEATNFSPDLLWIKDRDSSVYDHTIFDSVRGVNKYIFPSATNAEGTATIITSFDSNGFSLNTNGAGINANGNDHVAWCFNAGTDAPVSNTDGSITSTVKANQDAGFSVVKWTGNGTNGATIGHGLSNSPEIIITKGLSNPTSWVVGIGGVSGFGVNDFMTLQTTAAKGSTTTFYQAYGTDTFQVGVSGANEMNKNSSNDYISYCFHSVDGIQKIGSYTGTGAAGNIIETGFEPAFVMIKCSSAANGWIIWDNKRGGDKSLFPHSSTSEVSSTYDIDFASNGFIIQSTNTPENASGQTYIYLAIAADPDTTTPIVEDSFEVVTYTGNGGSQDIDTGFKPDLVWIKSKNLASNHALYDSVRGVNKRLVSSGTNAEISNSAFPSFNSNGFSLATNDTSSNSSSGNYVAWVWKAGDHDDNLPQINTEGTIDSVVSVNDAAGFSIVKYTGDGNDGSSIGHGLSQRPDLIFVKGLDNARTWMVKEFTTMTSDNNYLALSGSDAIKTSGSSTFIKSTSDSSVIVLGDSERVNFAEDYIAYCFTSITGYQKIGSYTGTGATGNAVTTGFSPRFVMIKDYTQAGNWIIHSKPPTTTNPSTTHLRANSSAAEDSGAGEQINFDSNGFTIVGTGGNVNTNNDGYIYLAIA